MQPKAALPTPRPSSNLSEIAELLLWGEDELEVLGEVEARQSAERLLCEISSLTRVELYLKNSSRLSSGEIEIYKRLIAKRKSRVPLAYLTKRAYFWDETLEVNEGCLIPRPETEILVESFLKHSGFSREQKFSFLDLGTGSGAIGVALLRHFPQSAATLADVSPEALKVAKKNLERYGLINTVIASERSASGSTSREARKERNNDNRAEVILSNLFESFSARKWNAIFSNPPYLSAADWKDVQPELLHEPRTALEGGEDGLDFYRRIAREAGKYLEPKGWLVLEMGIHQAPEIKKLLAENGFKNIAVFKDHGAVERVIMGQHG
ncbi:MAG: peptide chain release factor N(5)-glutamine methyltransferase [Candidatus Omnitrophica bacterium]|nr:peptide chain release factor N(5)-glutamine methyltransferase [Candidatus Omnitrophota bacterium]